MRATGWGVHPIATGGVLRDNHQMWNGKMTEPITTTNNTKSTNCSVARPIGCGGFLRLFENCTPRDGRQVEPAYAPIVKSMTSCIFACWLVAMAFSALHAAPLRVLAIGDSMTEEYAFELPFSAPDSNPTNANIDNFKKRTRKEGEARTAAQMASLFHELLPVIDNLERALASGASPGSQQIHQGVAMTLQQLRLLLNKHGIVTEECIGQMFDPHRHEAISQRYDPSQGDHIILEVLQRGYWQGERILRPARVVVNDLTSALSAQSAVKNSLD